MAAAEFPLNIPTSFEGILVCGLNISRFAGNSISGIGVFTSLYEVGFPVVEGALLGYVGEGVGKRTVEIIATIIVTILFLPFFCKLSLMYNIVAGGIKTVYGMTSFFAHKQVKDKTADDDDANVPPFVELFNQATQHFCFVGLDTFGSIRVFSFLFAGPFSFDKSAVKERFADTERDILDGSMFRRLVGCGRDYGLVNEDTAEVMGAPPKAAAGAGAGSARA